MKSNNVWLLVWGLLSSTIGGIGATEPLTASQQNLSLTEKRRLSEEEQHIALLLAHLHEAEEGGELGELLKRCVRPSSFSTLPYAPVFVPETPTENCTCDNFIVTGTATINNLIVTGTAIFEGSTIFATIITETLQVNNTLIVSGTAIINDLFVTGSACVAGDFCVGGTTYLGDVVFDGCVIGNFCVTGTAFIGTVIVTDPNTLIVQGNSLLNKDVTIGADLSVVGATQLASLNSAAVVHTDSSGNLSTSLIVDADITNSTITNGKLTTASSANNPGFIVVRDGSGDFSASTITANLSGNATTATTATNFSGPLSGDVTGTQSATVVSSVGGQTAANVAAATVLANAATSANTASAIVRRDGSGDFSASNVTGNKFIAAVGSAAAPTFTFTGNTNLGMYVPTPNSLSFATVGTQRLTIDGGGTVTIAAPTASSVAALAVSGSTTAAAVTVVAGAGENAIMTSIGTNATPAYSFTGNSNLGLYVPTANSLSIATVGTQRVTVDGGGAVTIAAPTALSTVALTVTNGSGADAMSITGGVSLNSNGSDGLTITGGGGVFIKDQGSLRLTDAGPTFSIFMFAPDFLSFSYDLILPPDGGSSGQVLTTDGTGTTSWANSSLPNNRLSAIVSPSQTLSPGNNTLIFGTVLISNAGYNSGTGVFTAPTTGFYLVTVQAEILQTSGVAGNTVIDFRINAAPNGISTLINNIVGTSVDGTAINIIQMSAGDQLTINAATAVTSLAQSSRTYIALQYLGA